MKAQHLVLVVLPVVVEAFVASPSFVARPALSTSPTVLKDTERDIDVETRQQIATLLQQTTSLPRIDEAESIQGMPWKKSIDPSLSEDALLYMPFWEWQMSFLKSNLKNLRALDCADEQGQDFSYNENTSKKSRIVSTCFASDEYRKIRMTYYDAGDNTQVFNSVWYPNPKYNLPILGIDLLSFGRKKFLAIVDFQPIHTEESSHAMEYEHLIHPIKQKYDSLKGKMSSKFYDETQFFSQQMLFSRFEDENIIQQELFPAFTEYIATHLKLVQDCWPGDSQSVLERQQAYDTYSAERDPATGLFATMFGKEWADGFVYDFLFGLAERKEGGIDMSKLANMGGPPRPTATTTQPAAAHS